MKVNHFFYAIPSESLENPKIIFLTSNNEIANASWDFDHGFDPALRKAFADGANNKNTAACTYQAVYIVANKFPPQQNNLFFLVGNNPEGQLRISYDDGETQIVPNHYTSSEWTSYKDVWNYDKTITIQPPLIEGQNTFFLWVIINQPETRELYKIEVAKIEKTSSATVSLDREIVDKVNNCAFIMGPNFRFNGVNYTEYDNPKGKIKAFSGLDKFTLQTESYAVAVFMEKI